VSVPFSAASTSLLAIGLSWIITLSSSTSAAQTQNLSPDDIVARLTGADRSVSLLFDCGETTADRDDRAFAKLLVRDGSRTLPAVERVFEAIERRGGQPARMPACC